MKVLIKMTAAEAAQILADALAKRRPGNYIVHFRVENECVGYGTNERLEARLVCVEAEWVQS